MFERLAEAELLIFTFTHVSPAGAERSVEMTFVSGNVEKVA